MRIGLNSPETVLALLVRRKWWVIAPFVALSCAIAILASFLPKIFVSEALILVQSRDVPKDFVKDLISGSTDERLNAYQQTVESRTNLIMILREFGPNLPELQRFNIDDQVEKLRNAITITFETQKKNGVELPLTYFRIAYQNRNPDLAQKITSRLTQLFIEQDEKVRANQVVGTNEFLSSEFAKVSEQLTDSEEKLKGVRSAHQFELPDQLDSNLRTLERLALDKKTAIESLDRSATQRLNLQTQISETSELIPRPATLSPSPQSRAAASENPLVADFRKAELAYKEISAKYPPLNPDVQTAKLQMERLKAQVPPEALADDDKADGKAAPQSSSAMMPNPKYSDLKAQLRVVDTEFEIREKEKASIEADIAKYSQRVENTPKTEEDMAEAIRLNKDLQKQYDDLKGNLAQAQLSESLESKQKGSHFVVVDPANFPQVPTKPNRKVIALAGGVASLVFGILFAAIVDVAHQRVWTQSEIETFWNVPVLVDIPEILTDPDLALIRKKKARYTASSVAVVVAYSFCLYLMYLKHGFILQQLDPVLQKVLYK